MKSRFICIVSSPNLWEDHHHLILSLRPVMGIQRAGYQTAQSAGKSRNVQLAHLDRAATAEGEQWLLASGQIAADAGGSHLQPPLPASLSLSPLPPLFFFFFTRIRFSLLHSIALLCHFLQLLSFPWNMALRQLIRVLHCVISSNFY